MRSALRMVLAVGICTSALCGCGSVVTARSRKVAASASTGPRAVAPRSAIGVAGSGTVRSSERRAPRRPASGAPAKLLENWPEFGLNGERTDASDESTGVTARNLASLKRIDVRLPGTVDSSPIYLHGVEVEGARHDVVVVTTTYGKTIAIDANSERILWLYTPPGYASWAGSAQITTASPIADPGRRFVYAASPNGLIHKLLLRTGAEARKGTWPVRVTLDPSHEKLTPALNIDGRYLLIATGGYYGDIPPYQGHVVAIDRASGQVKAVFNTLCAQRQNLIVPSTCNASDSAILSRSGPVVEGGGESILVATGNGPWNGRTNFGDSVIELSMPSLSLKQAYTPRDEEKLNMQDLDLGSGSPALVGEDRVLIGGKDGLLRLLDLSRLDGSEPKAGGTYEERLGGEVQQLPLPGGGELFTTPAVWQNGRATMVFVGAEHATAAFALRDGRLRLVWQHDIAGTSPVLAGGLLYVYEPDAGGIEVYEPTSGRLLRRLEGKPGHWNSPIVVAGHIVEPEGNANDHLLSGTLSIFSLR